MSIIDKLTGAGAVYTKDHLVLTSGRHSPVYINLRVIAPMLRLVDDVSYNLMRVTPAYPNVIVGPETMGRTLAFALAGRKLRSPLALWCNVAGEGEDKTASWPIKMGFEKILRPGMTAIVIDDLLTTGSSVKPVVDLLRASEIEVLGAAVIVRRNPDVTAETLGVPELWVLEDVNGGETYAAEDCPMCATGQPLRLRPGHGWKFAEEHPDHPSVLAAIH